MHENWPPLVENVLCPHHGEEGQVMEKRGSDGVYVCPECGRRARVEARWA